MRQLFHIRQTSTVAEYVERFSGLVDQLTAYDSPPDALCFTTRFVHGLKDDIKSVIAVQLPSSLDTACSLALLQDEMAEQTKKRDYRRPDSGFWTRQSPKGPQLLPPPPITEQLRKAVDDKKLAVAGQSAIEKLSALRAYRRARGLYDKCAEKWSRDHCCATTVQLQAMEEVWELFNVEDSDYATSLGDTPEMQLCLAISADAIVGKEGPRTLQLRGTIHGRDILILVDSGSTNSFISETVFQ